jgi:hypothetical protein
MRPVPIARRALEPFVPLCVLAVAVLALAGCGGDSSTTTTTRSTVPQEAGDRPEAAQEKDIADPKGQARGQEAEIKPGGTSVPPTPGAKAAAPGVPVSPGGDNSVQKFGIEGRAAERAQAIATLEDYLNARAARRWEEACAATSDDYRRQLAQAVAPTPDDREPEGCAQTLALLFGASPTSALNSGAEVRQVLSFRTRADGYAYLIFEGGGGTVRFIAMANEGGSWKVNTLEPAELPAEGLGGGQ